jgi:hypothetical protein
MRESQNYFKTLSPERKQYTIVTKHPTVALSVIDQSGIDRPVEEISPGSPDYVRCRAGSPNALEITDVAIQQSCQISVSLQLSFHCTT